MESTDVDGRPEVHVRRVEPPDLPDLLRMVTALAAHHGDPHAPVIRETTFVLILGVSLILSLRLSRLCPLSAPT
jgi:hypothetical protein